MNEEQQQVFRILLQVLSKRAILLLGIILDFVLFTWAMLDPSYPRLIGAGAFGILVLAASLLPTQS